MRAKRITIGILAVFLLIGIGYAASIGYNRSQAVKKITINPQFDEQRDTIISFKAPNIATENEEIDVSGRLVDKQTGEGIANKKVFVGWFGVFRPSTELVTDANGYFSGKKLVPYFCKDAETLTVTFPGE